MLNSDNGGQSTHDMATGTSSKKNKSKLHPQLSNVSFSALMGSATSSKPGNKSSNSDGLAFPSVRLRSLLFNTPFSQRSKPRRTCKNTRLSKNSTDGDSLRSSRSPHSSCSGAEAVHSLTSKGSSSHNNSKSSSLLNKDSEKNVLPHGSGGATACGSEWSGSSLKECSLCFQEYPQHEFPVISTCEHRACLSCMQSYLKVEITESRTNIMCPQCTQLMHPTDIHQLLNDASLSHKFEDFMLRRVLSVDPDTRWCPSPDCGYAVIASECASCPKLKCEREGCGTFFCYHCKASWHPNQTCDKARSERSPNGHYSTYTYLSDLHFSDELKSCPRCQVLIVKQNDGSCNHMTCSVCNSEFCWLCMKEISDLHYLSPSGCTFWGKKPWSRKKKILWQLGTLVGAPLGIGLIAGLAVPAVIIGIPIWVGRKLHSKFQDAKYSCYSKNKRNLIIFGGVTASALVSPLLAALSIGVGVPILLAYVYGVVPVSLCRSGGCGVTTSSSGVRIAFDNENDMVITIPGKAESNRDMQMYEFQSMSDLAEGREIDPESIPKQSRKSSFSKTKKVDVHAEISPGKLSIINIDSTSLAPSEKSMATLDPENDSTRALAGSLLHYKLGETSCNVSSCEPSSGAVVEEDEAYLDYINYVMPGYPAALKASKERERILKCQTEIPQESLTHKSGPSKAMSMSVVIDMEKLARGVETDFDDNREPLLQKHKSSDHIVSVNSPKKFGKVKPSKSQPELRN